MKKMLSRFSAFLVFFVISMVPIDCFAAKPHPIVLGYGTDPTDYIMQTALPDTGRIKLVQGIAAGHAGKNKPRYQSQKMDWRVYETKHFKLYSYTNDASMINWYLNVLEAAYEKDSKRFGVGTFEDKIPVIIYSSRKGFEETNLASEFIPPSLGGFTEISHKKRMTVPFSGSKEQTRHVLEHELTHSFQVEIAKRHVDDIPLWFIEGVAEHNSKDWSTEDNLILRDAYFSDILPALERENFAYGYLMYKYGQFAADYIYDNYKSEKIKDPIKEILFGAKKIGFEKTLAKTCGGLSLEELDKLLKSELGKRFASLKDKKDVYPKSQSLAKNNLLLSASDNLFATQTEEFGRDMLYLNYRKDNGMEIVSEKIAEDGRYNVETLPGYTKIFGNKIAYVVGKDGNNTIIVQSFELNENKNKIKLNGKEAYSWDAIREISNPVFISSSSMAFIGKNESFDQIYLFNTETQELKALVSGANELKGLTYSPALNILVTSMETDTGNKTNFDLIGVNLETGKIQRLTQTPENEGSPEFSPDGRLLLFVSDKGLSYNIYLYDLEKKVIAQITDARIGVFNPKWLANGIIAFNVFSKVQMDVYAMLLPKTTETENKKITEQTKESDDIDKLLKEKVAGWEDYEVAKKIFSTDKKTAVVVVNRGVSFEGKNNKESPIAFFAIDLNSQKVRQFSINEFKKMENFAGLKILQGSNVLIGRRTNEDQDTNWTRWFLYNWESQKLEEVRRPVKYAKKYELLSKGEDISENARYALLEKSGKFIVLDALENKNVWEYSKKDALAISFSSNNAITVLEETNKPAKSFVFLSFSLPAASQEMSYALPAYKLGKKSEIENWAVSPDLKKIAISIKRENKRLFRKNIESYDLWLIDVMQDKTEVIAEKMEKVGELNFNEKSFSAKSENVFGEVAYTVSGSSKTAENKDEPIFTSTETAKLLDIEISPASFKPDKLVKMKSAQAPSRFPTPVTRFFSGGMIWDINKNKPVFTLAATVFGTDDLNDRVYVLDAFLVQQMGIVQFAYKDIPSGQTFGFRYWNLNEDGTSVSISYAKNIFLNKFLNWDIVASEEYVEIKDQFPYRWLKEKSLKTRVGTTFSLDTTVWNWHGPHSGNLLFAETEAAIDSKGNFASMDMIAEGRSYIPITDRSGFAFRLSAGKSAGPEPTIFVMGGNKAFRGMPFLGVYGNNYILASADLRVPIFDFIGAQISGPANYVLWPFTRAFDVQSGIYIDAGNAWYNKGQTPYAGESAFIPDYSAGYFINVPTVLGLTLRFSQGVYGQKGGSFWIGYNW